MRYEIGAKVFVNYQEKRVQGTIVDRLTFCTPGTDWSINEYYVKLENGLVTHRFEENLFDTRTNHPLPEGSQCFVVNGDTVTPAIVLNDPNWSTPYNCWIYYLRTKSQGVIYRTYYGDAFVYSNREDAEAHLAHLIATCEPDDDEV